MAKKHTKLSVPKSTDDSQLQQVMSTSSPNSYDFQSYIPGDVQFNNRTKLKGIIYENNNREAMPSSSVKAKTSIQNAQSSTTHHGTDTRNLKLSWPQSSSPTASSTLPRNKKSEGASKKRKKQSKGRQKIPISFIGQKEKRSTTFSKRKKGIMKKIYEIHKLTGCEVVLGIVSETNNVSTFSTPKFQQILQSREGRNLFIQCLLTKNNSPSEDRMREGGYHEKEITMSIADHKLKRTNQIASQAMQNSPIQKSSEMMRLSSGPRSVHHVSTSQLSTCNHQMPSPSTHHITSHVKAENVNDKNIDNIYANIASAQNIRHQGNILNDVNNARSISTFNSHLMHGPSICYQGNSRNLVNATSSNLPGNSINTESNIHQQHIRNGLKDTIPNGGGIGFCQFTVQPGSDSISSMQRYPVLNGYHRDPQNEGHSTFTYDENNISPESSKDSNYDDTSSND